MGVSRSGSMAFSRQLVVSGKGEVRHSAGMATDSSRGGLALASDTQTTPFRARASCPGFNITVSVGVRMKSAVGLMAPVKPNVRRSSQRFTRSSICCRVS